MLECGRKSSFAFDRTSGYFFYFSPAIYYQSGNRFRLKVTLAESGCYISYVHYSQDFYCTSTSNIKPFRVYGVVSR